jgi:Phosphotransferase enzyme family
MLVHAGVACRVSTEPSSAAVADAVVLLRDARVSLRDALRMLERGGAFYAEVDRRLTGKWGLTPRRFTRQLSESGLFVTGVYLVLPRFDAARRYVPIDHSGLLDWYFETLHSPRSPLALLGSAGLRLAAGRKRRRLDQVVPWYGVTAISSSTIASPPSVLGNPDLPDSLRPTNVRTVMLTNGQDDGSRVVLLPFEPGGVEPIAAVKVSRIPAFNGNTEREQNGLAAIRQRVDARLKRSIPEPLGIVHDAGRCVAVETCAPGAALTASTGRFGAGFSTLVEDLRLSLGWLLEFQRQTQSGSGAWTSEDATHLDARLTQYAEELPTGERTRELLERTRAQSRALIGISLPKVCLHNDFGPWNVYRRGDHISVIDWELGPGGVADRSGPGPCDLIYFVTHWTLRARGLWSRAAMLRGFRELFTDQHGGGKATVAARQAIREYLTRFGINGRFLPPLLVYTWVERTLDQLARAQESGQSAAWVDQYTGFIDLLADRADRLFTDPPQG